jgi:SAM-dependent methyltransferase
MDHRTVKRIGEIKVAITAMLRERGAIDGNGDREQPSAYWASFCSRFSYMLGLPDDAFEQLRIHTYHLTADTYLTYFFETDAPEFRRRRAASLIGIPRQYWLREPPGGIGFVCDGELVSHDTQRFQHVVNTLYREGVLETLKNRPAGPRHMVLEIGGGYGGLAYHLTNLIDAVYIIVDLPETLLFSAAYLAMLQPNKKAYIYAPDTFAAFLRQDIASYDFVFIPNYRVEELATKLFDLVLNVASFQEMREDQVTT